MGSVVAVLFGHLIETVKLRALAVALYAAAAFCLVFASVFALVALRHWIVVTYASQYPDLWIALGFVVVAVPLIGVGLYFQSRKPKTNPVADIALTAGPPALSLVAKRMKPRTAAVGVVLIAGLFLGRRLAGGVRKSSRAA